MNSHLHAAGSTNADVRNVPITSNLIAASAQSRAASNGISGQTESKAAKF
jgi:hypothetical protein